MTAKNTIVKFEQSFIPEPNSGCWLWAANSPNGRYGSIKWRGVRKLAHVLAYELYKGTIEAGKVIDHLCRNTFCVNPDHLEAVSQLTNSRRSVEATKTHCVHGHPYADGVELYARNDGTESDIGVVLRAIECVIQGAQNEKVPARRH